MSVFHHKALPCESLSNCLQFGANALFLATSYKGNTIAVWCINELKNEVVTLGLKFTIFYENLLFLSPYCFKDIKSKLVLCI